MSTVFAGRIVAMIPRGFLHKRPQPNTWHSTTISNPARITASKLYMHRTIHTERYGYSE